MDEASWLLCSNPLFIFFFFLQCYLFMSIMRAWSNVFFSSIILFISRCAVVFSLPSCTHRNILEEFWYSVHPDALLRLCMTEVPSCPLPLLASTVWQLIFRTHRPTYTSPDSDMCTAPDIVGKECTSMSLKHLKKYIYVSLYLDIYQRFIYRV